jgi:hypothetical protein
MSTPAQADELFFGRVERDRQAAIGDGVAVTITGEPAWPLGGEQSRRFSLGDGRAGPRVLLLIPRRPDRGRGGFATLESRASSICGSPFSVRFSRDGLRSAPELPAISFQIGPLRRIFADAVSSSIPQPSQRR